MKFHASYQFFVSDYVLEEISRGDSIAAARRLDCIATFPVLRSRREDGILAGKLLRRLSIPQQAKTDAMHLAVAALRGQDYIVSWNFRHMANAEVRRLYGGICFQEGLRTPQITTPEEMLEGRTS